MDIEVKHNPLVLPFRTRVKVYNAKTAEQRVGAYCDARYNRGFRIRCVPEHDTNILELGARVPGMVLAIIRDLKDCGMLEKELEWRTNKLLLKNS